ncbi:MAG: hypothetical protein MJ095_00550 [Oscillospiraceae bacterium]|nr:hypothetical protein [Oscillospiraceae bacterium]
MAKNTSRRKKIFRLVQAPWKREYKDTVFRFLFGNPDNLKFTLMLYNAVNNTSYTDERDIEITTIGKVVHIKIKNDVSFLIDSRMNFYEHQSTYNPNMPVRMMIYAAKVYSNYITRQKLNIYSSSVIKLPVPKCICFYNGPTDSEDSQVFKLSDSFDNKGESDIEVSVTMYNINTGHNKELLNSCRPLAEYSEFVNNVRKYDQSGYNLSAAINKAIDAIPDEAMIKTVMEENRLEVTGMCIEEYTQEWADIVIKKEMDELKDQNQELTEENKGLTEKNRGLTEEIKRVESERSKAIEILRAIGVSDESIRKAYGSVD